MALSSDGEKMLSCPGEGRGGGVCNRGLLGSGGRTGGGEEAGVRLRRLLAGGPVAEDECVGPEAGGGT